MSITPQKIYFDIQNRQVLLPTGNVPNRDDLFPEIKIGQKDSIVNIQVVNGDIDTPYTDFPADCAAQWLTDNDYSNPTYADLTTGSSNWTASGHGSSEYYYTGTTEAPTAVYGNALLLTEGTLGSLSAGEWAYGDNDTIGQSRIYVRLSDSTDPDTKTNGYLKYIDSTTYTPLFIMALGDKFNLTNTWYDEDTQTLRNPDITDGELTFTINSNTTDFASRLGTDALASATYTEIQLLSSGDAYHFETLRFRFRCANKYLANPLSTDDPGAPFYNKTESDLKYLVEGGNVTIANSATANIILFSKNDISSCKFVIVFTDTVYENRLEAIITIEDDDSIIPHSIETDYNSGEEISISYTLDLSGSNVRFNLTNNSGNTLTGDYQVFELADSGLGARVDTFVWKGAWSGATTYNSGEGVSSGGSSYISTVDDNLNHTPPNASYWDLLCTGTPVSITASRVAVSDGTGAIIASSATATEAGYLSGVSGNIQTQLDGKVDENVAIVSATKTKITYDIKGLVTSGADATTADIADSTDARYVTDANLVVINNTSGINTGDDASAPATHASQHTNGTDNIQMASAAQIGLMSIAQASAVDTATNANTASTIVKRDGSGNFSAGTITAALTGNVTGNVTGSSGSCTGNSATVTTNANLTGVVTSVGNATSIASGAIKANMLQSAAEDLGAANVTINLSNSNGSYVTNIETDGLIKSTYNTCNNLSIFGDTISETKYGINCNHTFTDPVNGTTLIYLNSYPVNTGVETVVETFQGLNLSINPIINTSHVNNGYMTPSLCSCLRNYSASDSNDNGRLKYIYGTYIQYGHSNLNVSATPLTTNIYGLYLKPYVKTGTVTSLYDILVDTISSGGTVTNRWGYYQVDTAAKNYFGSAIGIGVTATASLHIQAGTATASTAPLKFTSGTLLSSPEAGAIEFLTDAFYGTITSGSARKTFAFLEAPIFTTDITTPICKTPQIKTDTTTPTDLTITTGAAKTLVLGTVVYDDANVAALTLRTGGTAPGVVQILDNDGDATGIYTIGFAVNEEGSGVIEVPHKYKEGTDLVFHIHWGANDAPAGGADNVKWQLTYSVSRASATFPDSTAATAVEVSYTTQYNWLRTDVATITGATGGVDGGNIKIGDQVHFTIKRIVASADEFGGEALMATIGFHYQIDTLGSRSIAAK